MTIRFVLIENGPSDIDPMEKDDPCIKPIQVECYSGYKANERPVAFIYQGRRWEISEILDRWYEGGVEPDRPIVDYFKVKVDGEIFILRYAAETDTWSVLFPGSG